MHIELNFTGEMESGVLVKDGWLKKGDKLDKRPEGITIAPHFYSTQVKIPVAYLTVYADDGEIMARYALMQAGRTGKLKLEDRKQPVMPHFELVYKGLAEPICNTGNSAKDEDEDEEEVDDIDE